MNLQEKENIEIEFWKNSVSENPEVFSRYNILNKMKEARIFDYKINKFRKRIGKPDDILELGGGQGWASCWLKKYYFPDARITTTDISQYAVMSLKYWERMLDTKLDGSRDCKSYTLPFPDASFDFVFCFAAAHHFVEHEKTLLEVKRVLRKNGICLYLNEPASSRLLYNFHKKHLNNDRQVVPEDVLLPVEMDRIAEKLGLEFSNIYDTNQVFMRSVFSVFYYKILDVFKPLQKILPCSADMVFIKN